MRDSSVKLMRYIIVVKARSYEEDELLILGRHIQQGRHILLRTDAVLLAIAFSPYP